MNNSLLTRFNDQVLSDRMDYFTVDPNGVKFDNDAFTVTYSRETYYDTFTFTQSNVTTVPTTTGNLTITLVDCFGHKKAFTLPVTITTK